MSPNQNPAANYASTSANKTSILDAPQFATPFIDTIEAPAGPIQNVSRYWQSWFAQVYRAVFHIAYTHHSDNEVPAGAVDGANAQFVLQFPANPPTSLQLFVNGALTTFGADYVLSTKDNQTLTFTTAPAVKSALLAFYRR